MLYYFALFLYTVEISSYRIIKRYSSWWNLFSMCLTACCIDVCLLVLSKYELYAVWNHFFFSNHAIFKISRSHFLLWVSM